MRLTVKPMDYKKLKRQQLILKYGGYLVSDLNQV